MNSLLFLGFSSLFSAQAKAGCETDMDCKGDRVCNQGVCMDPKSSGTEAAKTNGITEAQGFELERARAKARIGYGGAIATAALGASSLLLYDDDISSILLGAGALITAGITVPMASGGGASARGRSGR